MIGHRGTGEQVNVQVTWPRGKVWGHLVVKWCKTENLKHHRNAVEVRMSLKGVSEREWAKKIKQDEAARVTLIGYLSLFHTVNSKKHKISHPETKKKIENCHKNWRRKKREEIKRKEKNDSGGGRVHGRRCGGEEKKLADSSPLIIKVISVSSPLGAD